ncbi:hypothetical protein [Pontiella sulfatireligans]|uniref:PEP-CTERM protein-sorting domain-containing protein n=1 Tax=Pontiella sulfatireligans TaxID=2750658 RepID=A0A6C2UMV4_9BACT|nr:hypothetical protein [Pontiella sulfatireligans]VGO21605.1 hypothetical protein SCARR_03679 [Pontiella sulfatireligans]
MKKNMSKVILLLMLSAALTAKADVLAEWDIASVNGPNDSEVTAVGIAQGLSATPLTATGVTPISAILGGYPGSFAASMWSTGNYDANKYYSFSVSADAGATASISGISLSLTHGNYLGIGASNWVLRTSQDGFASDLVTYSTAEYAINEQAYFDSAFDSSLILSGSESVEFRLYGYYPGLSSDFSGLVNMVNGDYSGDVMSGTGSNVILHGVIPEPKALGLIGFAAAASLFVRRIFLV